MNTKLSARAQKALDVLRAGGKIRKALETDPYTRREQFQIRLIDCNGKRVPGFGFKTFYELEDNRAIQYHHPYDSVSSVWPQEWILPIHTVIKR